MRKSEGMRKSYVIPLSVVVVGLVTILWAAWSEGMFTPAKEPPILTSDELYASIVEDLRAKREIPILKGYLYSEEVSWAGHGRLSDGRMPVLMFGEVKREEVYEWEKGRRLFLCYDEARGATLLDKLSGKWLPVRLVYDKDMKPSHPIDSYLLSVYSMASLHVKAVAVEGMRLFRLEIDRYDREINALKYLPENQRKALARICVLRKEYIEQCASFGADAYWNTYNGTLTAELTLQYEVDLCRNALFDLAKLSEYYATYNEETPEWRR